jgi:hypothetical protein
MYEKCRVSDLKLVVVRETARMYRAKVFVVIVADMLRISFFWLVILCQNTLKSLTPNGTQGRTYKTIKAITGFNKPKRTEWTPT